MPSEAQSQEPRDRGPAPPVTRAGRSAQLARAAATSPALERRTRGRPRRDGGHSAPLAPPPPLPPPPPPFPKSRKKGRSRGRAQTEDEESMDAPEKNPPQKTEMKEKTPGRRRSTSRRKSNTNPEPDPEPDPEPCLERLSPVPDPDPEPPEFSPGPAPNTEDDEKTSAAPSASPPVPSPPVPPPLDPDQGPSAPCSPTPAPDPEEDRPSLSSPVPLEVDCNPSMEMEGRGASPIEQSLALSPCSSPLVSPCPQLEDEDSLSPLFQRSLSEDSGGSPTLNLGHTNRRLKQCAFCYRGNDHPPLGQGRLVVFGPTPGYIPLHILNRRASSDRDNDCHDHCYRRDQALPTCSSPDECGAESSSEFVEQLGPVGLPHDINVQSLFDPTGQCCAHLQCAAWSEGVCRGEGQSLLYVDKAIDSGSTQVCAFCRRLGASLRCRQANCGRSYHFPCAAAAGAQLDWSQRHTLCLRHTLPVSSQCLLCSGSSDVSGLLMCCCCGNCYHGSCLDPPVIPSPLCRAGWQCPQCRVCQSCRLKGDDGVLLLCKHCGKAYHTQCLTPPVSHTSSTAWSCKNCRICRSCGVRSSGQWANHPFLCQSCDPALPCPVCDQAPNFYTAQEYLTCICCYRCVHTECFVQAGGVRAESEEYVCSTCRPQEKHLVPDSPTPTLTLSPPQAPTISISQLPSPDHTEAPPTCHSSQSPVQVIFSETPQSPINTTTAPEPQQSLATHPPEPTDPRQSSAPPQPEPTDPHQSSEPDQPDPCHSSAPDQPQPTDALHSSTPDQPQPTDALHSLVPDQPQPTELRHSSAPDQPQPTELHHSSAPDQPPPTELHHSSAPDQSQPTELHHSSAPDQPQPTDPCPSSAPDQPQPTDPCPSSAPDQPQPTDPCASSAPDQPQPTDPCANSAPDQPQPTDPCPSWAPDQPHPTDPRPSSVPDQPQPTDPRPSSAPDQPQPTDPHHSSAPDQPQPSELHHSSAPDQPQPTELHHSSAPDQPQPTELHHSSAPDQPQPTELHHSSAPDQPEHTELHHSSAPDQPEHTELHHSSSPYLQDSLHLQQSPAPSQQDPVQLPQNPASFQENPVDLWQSPALTNKEPVESQHSPASPHPQPMELQCATASLLQDLAEFREIHEEPLPELTEHQESPAPSHPEPIELHHGPQPPHPEHMEFQHGSAAPKVTELNHCPEPLHPDPAELHHSQLSSLIKPPELKQRPSPSHPVMPEFQPSSEPPHADTPEHHENHASPHHSPAELPQSPTLCHSGLTELRASPTVSPACPAERRQSPTHVTSTQAQHGPVQLSDTSCSPRHDPTENQLIAIETCYGPEQVEPSSCSRGRPLDSRTKLQLEPSESQWSSPPHSPVQDYTMETRLEGPSSPDIISAQPQLAPPPSRESPLPHSPAQDSAPLPQSPTRDPEATLEQESPASSSPGQLQSGATQDISTLDQDLSPVLCMSAQTAQRHASQKPTSAPCSPSPATHRPTQRSLSQPASPVQPPEPSQFNLLSPQHTAQAEVTQEGPETSTTELKSSEDSPMQPVLNSQTLERSSVCPSPTTVLPSVTPNSQDGDVEVPNQASPVQSSALSMDQSSPPMPTPNSLVHRSPSEEHSSLMCSPAAAAAAAEEEEHPPLASHIHQSPQNISSWCKEDNDLFRTSAAGSLPEHTHQMPEIPASTRLAGASPTSTEPKPCRDRHLSEPTSPSVPPCRSSVQPASPSAVHTTLLLPDSSQDEEMEVDVNQSTHIDQSERSRRHPNSPSDSPDRVSTEAGSVCPLMDSVHLQETTSVCAFTETTEAQTNQSPTHSSHASPCHVHSGSSPSQTSPRERSPSPPLASFSPQHCRPTETSSASTSEGQTNSCSDVTDVSLFHSPPRSSHAGPASPVQVQITSSSGHTGTVLSQTPSSTSIALSSPVHTDVSASLPHSPGQASETYHSPCHSPAPDSGTSSGPTEISSSLDVSSPITLNSEPFSMDQLESAPAEPTDSTKERIPLPASSSLDDSSSVDPDQVSLLNQSPDGSPLVPDRSAGGTALESPPVDATHAAASLAHDGSLPSSPTQENAAMLETSHTVETAVLPPLSDPSQVSSPQTLFPATTQEAVSSGHMSPAVSSSRDPPQSAGTPGNHSPPQSCSSPGPGCPMRTAASPSPRSVGSPQPGGGLGSHQQHTATEEESAAPGGGEDIETEAMQQEKRSEEEETKPGAEPDREEVQHRSPGGPPAGVQQESVLRQQASSSPSASPSTFPHSPPPRAGSLEASVPCPHRTAVLLSSSPHTCPPPSPSLRAIGALEEDQSNLQQAEMSNEAESASCQVMLVDKDSQSQSQIVPVAVTEEEQPSDRKEEPPETPEPTATHMPASPLTVQKVEQQGDTCRTDNREVEEVQEDQSEAEEEPVSPVMDLDPSLDLEVMELMTSSSPPPSLLHLPSPSPPPFSRRGKGRSLRPPPSIARPSDDLSIRLRQSPFSTEASPETSPTRAPITPPPLSPPSPPTRETAPLGKAPPSTMLPSTPKIGMGKPAISKRKFSSGRTCIKQGSWWSHRRAVSPPSSSQDSVGEGGWDSPKPRPPDSPLWSMRVSRGSGFSGRRRSRGGGVGGGRGARGRSRLKTQDSLTVLPGSVYMEPFQPKEEEENSMHNTVVMFSTSDHFTLKQDMCVVCGSFGQGAEGRLLACSQCGQCYHPYCVNVKITRVILTKGWRCLECTVCEACGEASDPGRLLLCDDCDISYHTYCLDPPLHTVPKGAWKCKWCVWCVQCGSSSPGLQCDWQNNYSLCGPCESLSRCPLCQRQYTHDDLILQCQHCDRWVHAVCQGLTTEDEVETAADEGFDCSLCRTHSRGSFGRSDSLESPFMAQIISRVREPDMRTYTQDGVCLTESGLSHLQSLVEPLTSPRRYRRCKPKLKLRIINQNSVSVLQTPGEPDTPTEQDHSRGDLECEMKSDSSPERDHAHDDDIAREQEVTDGNKKRKRKPYRPGIGGFMVRQRGGKAGPSRIKLCRKDSMETLQGRDEDVFMETAPPADQTVEKVKKRYRKKKTKLEEAFPSYLQEAFFGRDLLDRSRQPDTKTGSETLGAATDGMKGSAPQVPSPTATAASDIKKQGMLPMSEGALVDLSDVLNTDPHILATGHTGHFQVERSPSPFAGLDIGSVADNPSLTGSSGRGQRVVQEEPLDAILSPELDKMVTDGAILSKLYKIPELEGKDVEEVFTAVLSPNSNNPPKQTQHTHPAAAAGKTLTPHTAATMFPRVQLMNGLMGAAPHLANTPMIPSGAQAPAGFRLPRPEGPGPGQAPINQGSAGDGEPDVMSTAQRSMLKWEKEETLGEMATVAPVLYCNTNFPQLREQYPDWSTRVKQIAKLWRKASSQDRAPFVQKARDNRAAQRINKVQLSNDPLKRHVPSQPPPPGPYDPVSIEMEAGFKDPLRPKESEQELEWKLRQQMRQKSKQQAKMEATQKLEQVKNEQLLQQRQQQQLMAAQRLAGPLSPDTGSRSPITPATSGNASPLQLTPSRDPRQQPLLQGGQGSGQADDVFLRPQAPPPSGFPHSPHSSSPLHQPPSSPQMFSPPSSRPSSPWDPYSKVVGTPRPTSSQAAPQQQRRSSSLNASPAHDAFGSPAPSPDSKGSDVSRALMPQPGHQQARPVMMSPPSGSGPDVLARHGVRIAESFQRTQATSVRVGELVQGGLFKAPMPPQHQSQPEVFGGAGGGRRDPSRPTDLNFSFPPSQDSAFPSSPLSGLGSPHRSPYGQTPGTPRPDYNQQITDPFTQQSPPYVNPQTPGTPHPHSDPSYLQTPPALRLDQYSQQSGGARPSPSNQTMDPYSSNPGTPRPSVTERFPRSPGCQRSGENQPAGTPRPSSDPYQQNPTMRPQRGSEAFSQAPGENFTPHAAGAGSSPLTPGETFAPTHHQSPGRQPDSFPRTPSSHTPKHPGMSEESCFPGLTAQTPAHDPFEQSHMAAEKTTNEMAALAAASLDGPMSVLPQLGDSEEKLRQRQRLRQLILRQQQQKSALRQDKCLQEGVPGPPATPVGTPRPWSQEDFSTAPPTDPFGRPPPPYPGTVRPGVGAGVPAPRFPGGFQGEQQRGFTPSTVPLPREGARGSVPRFAAPPAGLQDSFLRPPQMAVGEGAPVHMKRPGEFTGILPLPAPVSHMMTGVPQPFLPRSLPLQQHSIMGQPYIELRHRAPENRLRLSFPPPAAPEPELSAAKPQQGAPLGQLVMEQQQVGPTAPLTQAGEAALPGAIGIEEHLEGEDSAVKDLEDVEVKDLVDLNLNLDPEDGKEDLDLGPNDLHLDDFLLSGKFDLIAYADPELNLEDKKDMFNEELDLGEPVEEKEGGVCGGRKSDSQVKQEVQDDLSGEHQPGVSTSNKPPRAPGAEAAGPSTSLSKVEDSGSASGMLSVQQTQDQALSVGMAPRANPPSAGGQQSVFQQRPFEPSPSQPFSPHPQGLLLTPQGPPVPPHPMSLQPPQPHLLLNPQTQPPQQGTPTQTQSQAVLAQNQDQNRSRPLLLEEQPLLLQDLLDQERQEQQQQKQMQALIRQRSTPDTVVPNMADFDSISDPIMKAKMVALKGINKVMTQGNLGLNTMVINRFQQAPVAPVAPVTPGAPGAPGAPMAPAPEGTPQILGQDGKSTPQLVRPSPPSFGPGFANESQRRQYEEWLGETQQLLQMQQRLLEEQIAAHRKTKKSLSAKQRTAKKAGRAFAEEDAAQLRHVTEQQGAVQKQLEQIRKQQKDHAELIEDYRTKQQQRALQQQQQQPPSAPPMIQKTLPQPLVPLQAHQGAPNPARVHITPPGWAPGSRAPGMVPQRMPLQQPPPQAPPQAMVPGFSAGHRGPSGGPSGAVGEGAAPPRQVNFDDNNPFSEGFQERERRERLREQQERQRVQLLQEVERHRALQQRLELEQQGLLGSSGAPSVARVEPNLGPGGPAGPVPGPGGDGLSQIPFFSSELPQDFLQSPPGSRPPLQLQGQMGAPFPQHAGLNQAFTGPQHPVAHPPTAQQGAHVRPRFSGPAGPLTQDQARPAGMPLLQSGGQAQRFGHDSSSSSPCNPSAPLLQLYSDIIPDDKSKKTNRKRDRDDLAAGARTPLSSHSDDITAPPTPALSDTSCSTPTRGSMDQSDMSFSLNPSLCGLAPSSELEKQLSVVSAAQQRSLVLGLESVRGPLSSARLEVKEERQEGGACGGGMVKMEEELSSSSPLQGGGKDTDGGKELLRHLLKDKISPTTTPSPTQALPTARRQLSNDSVRSEEEDRAGSQGNMENSPDLLDPSGRKKAQRCKRLARPEKDRAPPKNKRRKKEEEDKTLLSSSSSSEPLMTHLSQLSVLPLMEPVLGVDLSLFPPYGSSSLGRDSRLTGSFGNASLDGVTDFYSQLIYKQNNLSNPPTPPASLPPTPPPVPRQKLVNGFASTDELSRKDVGEQEAKVAKKKGEEIVSLNHGTKTIDVPASLPTPPHNTQEELRVQDSSGRDSPDSYIPSSSPESVADTEVSRYPDLSFIKLEPPSPCPSPTFPIMPSACGKASAVKQEVKAEQAQAPPSSSNTDLVTVAITLNPVAAQNVADVMSAVAQLLRVPIPADYQQTRPVGPERSSLALLAGVRVPLNQSSTGIRQQRAPPAAWNKGVRMDYVPQGSTSATVGSQFCSYCKRLLGKGVQVVRELKQEGQSAAGSSLVFCSQNCSALHSSGNKAADPSTPSEAPRLSTSLHHYTNNMSSIAVHSLLHIPATPPSSSSPPLSFPTASTITLETKPRIDSLKVKVKLKPRPRAVSGGEGSPSPRLLKRLKNCRWRRWSISITLSRGPCVPNEAVAVPTEEEMDVLLKKFGACLRPEPLPKDQRRCCFCNQQGDGQTDGPARLLNLDLDLWVHLNCALWSSEVYETQAGALINVELALRRGLTLRCAYCQHTGATSGCNRLRCTNTYHFTCALQANCTFFKDKTMLCHLHKPRTVPVSGDKSSSCSPSSTSGTAPDPAATAASDPYDSELRCFAVFRRVFVQRDEARQIAAVVQRGERQHTFRVGSLLFRSVGRLLPHQMNTFHNKTAIFPIGYHANRIYWSMRHLNSRCKYMCYVEEQEGQPLFKVKVVEKGYDDLILTGPTPKDVWEQVLEPVSQMRSSSGTLKLFPVYLKGEDLFGLTTSAVTRIVESLPGVESCERYTFRYGRNPLMEWPLAFNPSGSARSEPKACQVKRPTLLTSVAPRCQGTVGSIVGLVPGVLSLSPGESVAGAHQGRHSKSSQYRRMKTEWKSNVYLARSRIQGLGLYAARDIEKCTMVIEYIGTIIRSEVANRKERLYESQNRGVYMFRIDNDYVIDATITGGPARYINHSCSPNCITEVVTVEKENKIIISSCRRIQRGEELSYDYKFDLEDDQHKIPCHCGAVNCRKWMN